MSQNDSQTRSDRGQYFDTLKKLKNELEDEIQRQESAVKKLEQEILDLRFGMSKLNEEKRTLQQRLNNQDLDICLKTKEIENLQVDARLLKDELEQTKEEANKRKDKDIKALEKKNKELEKAIAKLNKEKEREINKLRKEHLEFKNATNKEKAALQLQIKEKDNALKSKTEENKNFVASARCMEEEYRGKEREFNKTIKNLSDGKSRAEALVYEKQRFIEQMQTALNNHVSTINSLEKDKKDLTLSMEEEYRGKEREFNKTIKNLSDGKSRAEALVYEKQRFIEQMQTALNNHVSIINSLEKDKKDLTLRLGKLAGANLTYNNPNIADLSDENRPTKLAEEFSELYDNEWTDAFEMVEMESEQDKAQFMLHILKSVNQLCQDTLRNHMDAIKSSLSTLVIRDMWTKEHEEKPEENVNSATASTQGEKTNTEKEVGQQDKYISCSESENIKDKPVTVAKDSCISGNQTSFKTNEAGGVYTLDRIARDHTVLNAGGTEPHAEGNSNDKTVRENTPDGIHTDNGPKDDNAKYQTERKMVKMTGRSKPDTKRDARDVASDSNDNKIGKDLCTDGERSNTSGNEIIKTPDANDNKTKHSPITGSTKRCSVNGKKAFDPLTLSADFEQLASEQKTKVLEIRKYFEIQLSEQFCKVGSSIIQKEMGLDQHGHARESIVKYIEKCMVICWSMCKHDPPVHIEFLETEGDQSYDTNMFKTYTKTGKYLDFVVWPALYLYENGPMLVKGVAQGRK